MSSERITITLPPETASVIETEVAGGHYVSASAVVHEALLDWSIRKQSERDKLDTLRRAIDEGLADIASERVYDFDIGDVLERGRQRSGKPESSA
jgi:antitoxin ParD1/3/4